MNLARMPPPDVAQGELQDVERLEAENVHLHQAYFLGDLFVEHDDMPLLKRDMVYPARRIAHLQAEVYGVRTTGTLP